MTRTFHRPFPGQAVLAWVAGCGAVGLTLAWGRGVAGLAGGKGADGLRLALEGAVPITLAVAGLALFLTCVPMPLLVWLMRAAHWRRGGADLLLGAGLGAGLVQIFGLPLAEGAAGWGLTGLAALAGAMGGLVYWLAAGRPGEAGR